MLRINKVNMVSKCFPKNEQTEKTTKNKAMPTAGIIKFPYQGKILLENNWEGFWLGGGFGGKQDFALTTADWR